MSSPNITIVLTSYKRAPQLKRTLDSILVQPGDYEVIVVDDGPDQDTEDLCVALPVRYIPLRRPDVPHRNSSVVLNAGLRAARGDVIILQNAECVHISHGLIGTLTSLATERTAVFVAVAALDRNGKFSQWYCHPIHRPFPAFFLGAIRRKFVCELGGFDENFVGYGCEDNDFAERARILGWKAVFLLENDAYAEHQWHGYAQGAFQEADKAEKYFHEKLAMPVYPMLAPWPFRSGVSVDALSAGFQPSNPQHA